MSDSYNLLKTNHDFEIVLAIMFGIFMISCLIIYGSLDLTPKTPNLLVCAVIAIFGIYLFNEVRK